MKKAMVNNYSSRHTQITNPNSLLYIKDNIQRETVISKYLLALQSELEIHDIQARLDDNSKLWNIYGIYDLSFFSNDMSWFQGNGASPGYDLFVLECVEDYEVFKQHKRVWYIFADGYCGSFFERPTLMHWDDCYQWDSDSISCKDLFSIIQKIGERETDKFHKDLNAEKGRWAFEQDCFDDENFF